MYALLPVHMCLSVTVHACTCLCLLQVQTCGSVIVTETADRRVMIEKLLAFCYPTAGEFSAAYILLPSNKLKFYKKELKWEE